MTHVILVHGAFANEKSWFDVPAALKSAGHTVDAIRLPGHAVDAIRLPGLEQVFEQGIEKVLEQILKEILELGANSSVTMKDYVHEVEKALPASPEKCCLIGHSMGGMVISQAAANFHDRVERLIYVTAMLPTDGETANEIINRSGSGTGDEDFLTEIQKHVLKHGERVLQVLSPQPLEPLKAPFTKTAGFAALARHFIRCLDDRILPVGLQDKMIKVGEPIDVRDLDSGHIPQLDVRDELNKTLTDILAC